MSYRDRVLAAKRAVEDAYDELETMPKSYGGRLAKHGPMRAGCRVMHRDGRQGVFLRPEGPTGAVVYFKRGQEPRVLPMREIVRVA